MPHPLPHGTVTFLFSDVEGSTGIAQRLGAGFVELMGDVLRLIRDGVSGHDGFEVKSTGDGVFAVFEDAVDALNAANQIQRAIEAYSWPPGGRVRVRLGIHKGDAQVVDGDYVGIDVHRAARVMDAGHGGQVVLSESARLEAEGRFDIKPLGTYRLRGLDSEERLSQLVIEGLPAEFPPLRSTSASQNNLPKRLSSLIGREDDLEAVEALVNQNRLVTILGPGGVGKTSLALSVAGRLVEQFRDGVFLVDLSGVSDPALMIPTVATEMSLESKTLDGVIEALGSLERLLVLDNMEQVIEAADDVAELLAGTRTVSVLATSQIPLRIEGERRHVLSPLETSADPDSAAVRLFVERAQSTVPSFDAEAEEVAQLVAFLDGLPLAIELVAARSNLFPPHEMLKRLKSGRMSYPKSNRSSSRQKSLDDALEWSYSLLSESTQRFFRNLGVFAGPLTAAAAEEVAGWPDAEDPLAELAELVDRSLVTRSLEADQRFRMLNGIRRFAAAQLDESGEKDEVVERLVDYFVDLGRRADGGLQGDRGEFWRQELEDDLENLRVVMSVLQDQGRATDGLELLGNTWRFFQSRGHMQELDGWLDEFLSMPGAEADTPGAAKGLMARGAVRYWQRSPAFAIDDYEEAVTRSRRIGDRRLLAEALYGLATSRIVALETESALEPLQESRELFTELDDMSGVADVIAGEAFAELNARGLSGLGPKFAEAGALYEKVGRRTQATQTLFAQAGVALVEGDLDRAEAHAMEGIRRGREMRDVFLQAWGMEFVSRVAFERGHVEHAALLAGAAAAAAERIGGGWSPQTIGLEDTSDLLVAELGERRAEEAMEPGRKLTTEEAVTLALGE